VPDELNRAGNGDSRIADRELRVCTVRIDIDGSPKGTGFFVAPGHVLTCAHVLDALADQLAPDAATRIGVTGVDGAEYAVTKVAEHWKDDDLAVLRVSPADQHPCVLLIGGQNFDDRFLTFGYPELHPEGVASPLVGEGNTGDERLLRLGEGQVQPGMSGGPLLNRRTGGVCGVLKLTRNEQMALGGYAIPVEGFWLRSPTLKRQNEAYHKARRREWFDLLPVVQRRVLLAAWPGGSTAEPRKTLFVVSVGGDRSDWRVSAKLYPSEESLPAEPAEVHLVLDQVARLLRDWAARGVNRPIPRRFNQGEAVRLLGSILFSAVLPEEIGKRFDELMSAGEERIQLALHFDRAVIPAEFVEMPWEYLYLGGPDLGGDAQVAADENLSFVRVQTPVPQKPAQPPRRQLSALMVAVTSPDQDDESTADDLAAHACDVADELDAFGDGGMTLLKMPPAIAFREEIVSGAHDIVHYVGFGRYHEGADQLALGGAPTYDYRNGKMLAALLPDDQRPEIVVLQQIEGPRDVVPADLSVFAWKLLERGVEGVVAYQFPLPRRLSKQFNKEFYTQIAAGESFETAVQKARALLWAIEPDLHAFLSPAAFMARPGELRLTAPASPSASLQRVGVTVAHA
jgi:hypothetical protein